MHPTLVTGAPKRPFSLGGRGGEGGEGGEGPPPPAPGEAKGDGGGGGGGGGVMRLVSGGGRRSRLSASGHFVVTRHQLTAAPSQSGRYWVRFWCKEHKKKKENTSNIGEIEGQRERKLVRP